MQHELLVLQILERSSSVSFQESKQEDLVLEAILNTATAGYNEKRT